MKNLGKFAAVTTVVLAFTAPSAAEADPGTNTHQRVDITVEFADRTCTWTDVPTGGNPPSPLSIYSGGRTGYCDDGTTCTLNGNPTIVFDDLAGTATIDRFSFTCGTQFGVFCTHEATNIPLTRTGTTREYIGTFIASRTAGSGFFCPSSLPGTMTLRFY